MLWDEPKIFFLERRYFFSIILSEFLKNRVALQEQGGKRPVVVLQNNIGNRHSTTLIVATVTTRTEKKKNQPTHVLVDSNPAFEEPSMILLEQIFTIDKSHIERFMGYASKAEMLRIDMALLVSLALNVLGGNHSE
ncbi:type II toxin-antitoxin system PemK/MazF family toxin [Faecalibacterium prausnitzii]|uniref:type II toxin-antitoxin system PemK/MazF family toxin n=1 Tax=Faecalibacterium prausnitzii TaxID=853 RepID=UPI0011736C4C|nr:type II toxin-antitoxin system PemK/MazF family toxin [Faecalibacterium prausnitzii]VUW99352.1 mRNA interferase MazF [Faecalibacterium prausnitzii]